MAQSGLEFFDAFNRLATPTKMNWRCLGFVSFVASNVQISMAFLALPTIDPKPILVGCLSFDILGTFFSGQCRAPQVANQKMQPNSNLNVCEYDNDNDFSFPFITIKS